MENNDNKKECNRKLNKIREKSITKIKENQEREREYQEEYDYVKALY